MVLFSFFLLIWTFSSLNGSLLVFISYQTIFRGEHCSALFINNVQGGYTVVTEYQRLVPSDQFLAAEANTSLYKGKGRQVANTTQNISIKGNLHWFDTLVSVYRPWRVLLASWKKLYKDLVPPGEATKSDEWPQVMSLETMLNESEDYKF